MVGQVAEVIAACSEHGQGVRPLVREPKMRMHAVGCCVWAQMGRTMFGGAGQVNQAMVASYRYDKVLSPNTACKAGSDRLGTSLFDSEADRGAMHLLIAGAEPLLLFFGEYLVEPILAEANDGPADAYDAAEVNTDAQNHRGSPERPQRDDEGGEHKDPTKNGCTRAVRPQSQDLDPSAGVQRAGATYNGRGERDQNRQAQQRGRVIPDERRAGCRRCDVEAHFS